jgi:hypothetical protein
MYTLDQRIIYYNAVCGIASFDDEKTHFDKSLHETLDSHSSPL